VFGNVLVRNGPDALEFVQLPSSIRRVEVKQWRLDFSSFGFSTYHYAVDTAQDLIVAAKYIHDLPGEIHLRSMRSGEAHPLATQPVLSAGKRVTWRYCTFVPTSSDGWSPTT